jgi:hypothetical protein
MRHVITALLLCAANVFAAPPKLEFEPGTKNTCEIVYLTLDTDAKSVVWITSDDAIKFTPEDKLVNKREPQLICNKTGKFQLTAIAISDKGEWTKVTKWITFVKGDSVPTPPPPPVPDTPVPPPPPVPDTPVSKGQISVHLVETTLDAVIVRSHLFDEGQVLRKWQDDGKHKVRACHIAETDKEVSALIVLAKTWMSKGNKLPYMLITRDAPDGSGTKQEKLWEGATPEKPADLLNLLRKYGN